MDNITENSNITQKNNHDVSNCKPTYLSTSKADELRMEFLSHMAKKYIWWKTPEDAVLYPQSLLAQVMNIGVWDDLCLLVSLFSKDELLGVLNNAEIGQFNPRSWHFWNYKLIGYVPPMPKRIVE